MADKQHKITPEQEQEAENRQRLIAPQVYEIVRLEGEHELRRPLGSLWWSGIAAGIAISASLLGLALLHHYLPDTPYKPLLQSFGYCIGFVIVILGRMQLFTENTVTVILPLLARPGLSRLGAVIRLWGVVLAANLVGTLAVAIVNVGLGTARPEFTQAMIEVAWHYAHLAPIQALLYGIPSGFFIAAIVWMLPSSEGSEFWVIVALTYLIAVGGFTHVVAGSAEVFLLLVSGQLGIAQGMFGLVVPTFVGNVIGGTGLFALLAYGQVREEMSDD